MNRPKQQVLVIGGGVAGLAAARTLERYGLKAHLVEKQGRLGGQAVRWACMATDHCRNCGACLSVELVDQIERHSSTQVYLNTRIEALVPLSGGFRATLSGARQCELTVDAVVLATGMRVFDPSVLEPLQYGRHPRVITTADLNRLLQTEKFADLLGENRTPAIAFIQCVGSRNKSLGNDYCSQVCCKVAMRQAGKLRQLLPEARLSICHIDLQLIGKEIRSQAAEIMDSVNFLQGVTGEIRIDAEADKLVIIREDPERGERQAHYFDLVVLAVGMRPAGDLKELLRPLGVPFDSWGFISGEAPLPSRLQVAGAGKFPTDITGAIQQGINAAHRIATGLEKAAVQAPRSSVAVFGAGWEGRRVARAVQAAGHDTLLLDAEPSEEKNIEAYELIPAAHIVGLGGTAGKYTLQYRQNGQTTKRQVAAVIIANGVTRRAMDPALPVVSLSEMEQTLVADWKQIPARVVFWLDHHGPEYKTNFRRALESAIDLTASGRQVSIIMERVLVHDPGGQQMYDRARRQGVRFLRAVDAGSIKLERKDDDVAIRLKEATLPAMELCLTCDLVVASDQILPGPHTAHISGLIKEPVDREGFAQSANVRLRPIGSRKRGIFYVGGCHEENDAGDLDREIQNLLCRLALMNQTPPDADEAARIDEGLCGRCLTCFRTCPHGAVAIVRESQPEIQPEACMGCGRCAAQCPAQAISLDQAPLDVGRLTRTVVYACRRSGYLAAEKALAEGLIAAQEAVSIIPVACCRSRIGVNELLKPLALGARRVVVAACHQGNCRSLDTGRTADAHLEGRARSMGLQADDIRWHAVAANEPLKMSGILMPSGNKAKGGQKEDQQHV